VSNYDNNLSGALFPNDKEGNQKRPDLRGSIEIDGQKFWCSAWTRTADKGKYAGKKFLSLKLERAEQQPAQPPPRQDAQAQGGEEEDSQLPF